MAFVRQVATLTGKNLRIVFLRSLFYTPIRAFLAPIIYMFFISYMKNFFVPPSNYGIGSATPVRSLGDALGASAGGRNTVVFVHNGHTGGDIETVIDRVSAQVRDAGKTARIVAHPDEILAICPSSLRGVTTCFGAAQFVSSPDEGPAAQFGSSPNAGPAGIWNYTLRADTDFGIEIYVDQTDNDVEIYVLPLQRAIDIEIARLSGQALPDTTDEYPYTSKTPAQRDANIRSIFMDSIINVLATAFFLAVIGVIYHLIGVMASEREQGLSQLIEAMTPNRQVWHTQVARLTALHLSFTILYGPAWIIMSLIMARLVFPTTSVGVPLVLHLLAGPALTSFSIFGGSFFRKSQLSGISVTIISAVLAVVSQVTGPTGSAAVAILSLLFPPMTYTFSIIYMAHWEKEKQATDLTKGAPGNPWQVPGIVFYVFFIIQTIVFPALGALVERKMFGTGSNTRTMNLDQRDGETDAIALVGFSKHYRPGWWRRNVFSRIGAAAGETVAAVTDLTFTALRGQITVLLGANGSGKSTTLDAIAGLNSITAGQISVDGTGGLGLCPQKNVLWDDLTVLEHVQVFNRLKSAGKPDSKDTLRALIRDCDLDCKMNAKAKTLSGGQKRKLQLAMMFTGGSHVCLVDEMSSGLDPLSRKKIQTIILRERGRRTLLLTTHFLDEADVLSDQIIILSKGHLKAEGTAVHLKNLYGEGYRVQITGSPELPLEFQQLPMVDAGDNRRIYRLTDSAEASRYVHLLDQAGVGDYQVFGPTVEDVFLRLADEVRTDGRRREDEDEEKTSESATTSPPATVTASDAHARSTPPDAGLLTGAGTSMFQQVGILFRKRVTILQRNYLPYLAAVFVPIAAAGLVTLFLQDFSNLSCDLKDLNDNPDSLSLRTHMYGSFAHLVMGPPDQIPTEIINRLLEIPSRNLTLVDTVEQFNQYISANFSQVEPGGVFIGDGAPLFAYRGDWGIQFAALTQCLLDSILSGTIIETQYQSFSVPFGQDAGKSLQLVLYFGLAMTTYPAFFCLYTTMERLRNVRALHYSNGIRSTPLWLAYLLFDSIFVVLVSVVTTGIFVGAWGGWWAPGYLFVVLLLYGITSVLLVYVVSLFATSQLAAFGVAAGGQAGFLALYFVIYMSILTYIPAADIDHDLILAHYLYSLITPTGSLMRGMFLALNEFSVACDGRAFASYPGDIMYYGGPILYLILQAFVLFGVLLWWESGWRPGFLNRSGRAKDTEETDLLEPDLRTEIERVNHSDDGLRALHLNKAFSRKLVVENVTFGIPRGEVFALLGPNGAGKSTTISLIRGDLRPTGGRSNVTIEGNSIIQQRVAARRHLGVCPQFDAMDQMTVLEHLRFYARARGVPDVEHNVARVITAVGLDAFQTRLAAKLSGGNKRKLSLAIAIMGNPSVLILDEPSSGQDAAAKRVMWRTLQAITPGRSLLITTHSMEEADALADRAGIMACKMLALGSVHHLRGRYGNAYNVHLVHTDAPHTTEEDGARLRSWVVEHIPGALVEDKAYHGQLRFTVPIAPKDAQLSPSSSEDPATTDAATRSVNGNEKTHPSTVNISTLFRLLEAHKEDVGISYYSVSETTLEQIFLTIVNRHNVEEEGHAQDAAGRKTLNQKLFSKIRGTVGR